MEESTEKAKISNLKYHKALLLAYSVLEMLFCAGPIFGWASLAYVLKKERYFTAHCPFKLPSNGSDNELFTQCSSQEQQLNIVYTTAFVSVGLISFPAGYMLDLYGPRTSRFASR